MNGEVRGDDAASGEDTNAFTSALASGQTAGVSDTKIQKSSRSQADIDPVFEAEELRVSWARLDKEYSNDDKTAESPSEDSEDEDSDEDVAEDDDDNDGGGGDGGDSDANESSQPRARNINFGRDLQSGHKWSRATC
ncbi:hypothetical protein HDU84_004669 [Entophlyctis sp. JEL0112]|nr:hypothetical protein HDU84_004669 [Entophlyctis sp. JEL0112]